MYPFRAVTLRASSDVCVNAAIAGAAAGFRLHRLHVTVYIRTEISAGDEITVAAELKTKSRVAIALLHAGARFEARLNELNAGRVFGDYPPRMI